MAMRAFVGLLGAALAASGAVAQDTDAAAERPDAILVSTFRVADLDAMGIRSTRALVGHVPNLLGGSVPGLGSASAFYLRGLGTSETIASVESPVSLYIDGVQFSRLNGNDLAFFDVERVDVLRGAQDALYGRNSSGGAVQVKLARPGDKVGGFVEGGYGSFDRLLARGSIDLPVGEHVAVKISAYAQEDDGYAKNHLTGDRLNDDDRAGVRIAAQLTPVERLTWNIALAYTEANGDNLLTSECDPTNPEKCGGRYSSTGMTRGKRLGGFEQYDLPVSGAKAGFTLGNAISTTLLTSNLEWAGERVKLQLLTGFADVSEAQALDYADGRAIPDVANPDPLVRGFANGGYAVLNDGSHRQFSQEVRLSGELGPVSWIAGGLVQDEESSNDIADMFTAENGTPTGAPMLVADRVVSTSTTAWAGYAQLDIRPLESVTLSAGLRYTNEERSLSARDNRGNCAITPTGCLAGDQEQSAKVWTPNATLSFAPSEGLLLFARAARGYRSGGWNARAVRTAELLPYGAETAWTYEAGVKSMWFDGKLRAGLTGLVLDASALQSANAVAGPLGVDWRLLPAGGLSNKGVELEVAATPIEGLGLYFNLGWQDAQYDATDAVRAQQSDCRAQLAAGQVPLAPGAANAPACAVGIVAANGDLAQPAFTPDFTLAFGGSYDFPIPPAGIVLMPSIDFLYRSRMETAVSNASLWSGASGAGAFPANPFAGGFISGSRADPFWQVNLSLALRTDDDNWSLALTCENCLERTTTEASFLNQTYLNRPLTWLLSARRRF